MNKLKTKIYTGALRNIKKYKELGYFVINIEGITRRYNAPAYVPLNRTPSHKMKSQIVCVDDDNSKLNKLDPLTVYNDLVKMSDGKHIILCSKEKTITNISYRSLISNWFEKKLNIEVDELEI